MGVIRFWLTHRSELAAAIAQHVMLVGLSTLIAVGAGSAARDLRRPPSAAERAARRPRQHRPDGAEPGDVRVSAPGAADRRRRRPRGDRRADPVRSAPDRADDDCRSQRHRSVDPGGRRGDGHDGARAACGRSSCRWRCRRSSPACACRRWWASDPPRLPRRSAPAVWANTSTAGCRWWIRASSSPARFRRRCWRWSSTADCCGWSVSCRRGAAPRSRHVTAAVAAVVAAVLIVSSGAIAARSRRGIVGRIEELHRAADSRRARRAGDRARDRLSRSNAA